MTPCGNLKIAVCDSQLACTRAPVPEPKWRFGAGLGWRSPTGMPRATLGCTRQRRQYGKWGSRGKGCKYRRKVASGSQPASEAPEAVSKRGERAAGAARPAFGGLWMATAVGCAVALVANKVAGQESASGDLATHEGVAMRAELGSNGSLPLACAGFHPDPGYRRHAASGPSDGRQGWRLLGCLAEWMLTTRPHKPAVEEDVNGTVHRAGRPF